MTRLRSVQCHSCWWQILRSQIYKQSIDLQIYTIDTVRVMWNVQWLHHQETNSTKRHLDGKLVVPQVRVELSYLAPPRQWKHFRPLFQAVFLSGGGITSPDRVKHHASQSQDRNNKYFILYIEFMGSYLLFRLARMRHAWKGDCYLTVLVFSWQILFLLSEVYSYVYKRKKTKWKYLFN